MFISEFDSWDKPKLPGERRRRIHREVDLPEAPPEPPISGFNLFVVQMTTKLRHDRGPHVPHDQAKAVQEISNMWRMGMSDEERQYYNTCATRMKDNYEKQIIEYRATGSYTANSEFKQLPDSNVWVKANQLLQNALEKEICGYDTVVFPRRPPSQDEAYAQREARSIFRRKLKAKGWLKEDGYTLKAEHGDFETLFQKDRLDAVQRKQPKQKRSKAKRNKSPPLVATEAGINKNEDSNTKDCDGAVVVSNGTLENDSDQKKSKSTPDASFTLSPYYIPPAAFNTDVTKANTTQPTEISLEASQEHNKTMAAGKVGGKKRKAQKNDRAGKDDENLSKEEGQIAREKGDRANEEEERKEERELPAPKKARKTTSSSSPAARVTSPRCPRVLQKSSSPQDSPRKNSPPRTSEAPTIPKKNKEDITTKKDANDQDDNGDFYNFNDLMDFNRSCLNWLYMRGGKLHSYKYVIGDKAGPKGKYGTDFFHEEQEVIEYCRNSDYENKYAALYKQWIEDGQPVLPKRGSGFDTAKGWESKTF